MFAWWCLSIGIGAVAIAQMRRLNARRRRLCSVPPSLAVSVPRPQAVDTTAAPMPHSPALTARPPAPYATPPTAAPALAPPAASAPADTGIVYIDAAGHCTLADSGARQILDWSAGERTLSEMLAGGPQESAALLTQLTVAGAVEVYATALAGTAATPVEVSAVALRDRDDNIWGAALFIHRAAGTHSPLELDRAARH